MFRSLPGLLRLDLGGAVPYLGSPSRTGHANTHSGAVVTPLFTFVLFHYLTDGEPLLRRCVTR